MNSIQRRLSLALAALCCLLWLGGGTAVYLIMRAGMIHGFDFGLKSSVDALTNMTEQSEKGLKFDSSGEFMPAFQRRERPDYFQLWELDGATLYRSPSLEEASLPHQVGTLVAPKFWNLRLPDGARGRAVGVQFTPKEDEDEPRTSGGRPLNNEVTLVAAFHRQDLDRQLNYLAIVLLLVGAAMAATSAFVVGRVVRRGLRPLSALAERAATINASSLQLRFPVGGVPDEIVPIAERLNDLLGRLEASFARERRFSADVAHELRTPIAELRALTEVALKWPGDPAFAQSALQDALGIALQMQSIATNLLALARCESNLFTAKPRRVSVAEMFDELLLPLIATAGEKALAMNVEIPEGACWFTDPTALRCIVSNLMTNAVKYSPTSSAVRVRITENGSSEQLLISNRTGNLVPEDMSHLFERFWRKESARSSSLHCGLGLPLASAYARALGLKLTAQLSDGEITFVLGDLPTGEHSMSLPLQASVPVADYAR